MVRELQIPREAMGRGDLKFLAAIGAFLGWRAVLCSIFAGSLAGSVVGLTSMLLGRARMVGENPVWSLSRPRRACLDVFRRAFGCLVCRFADALTDAVKMPHDPKQLVAG